MEQYHKNGHHISLVPLQVVGFINGSVLRVVLLERVIFPAN